MDKELFLSTFNEYIFLITVDNNVQTKSTISPLTSYTTHILSKQWVSKISSGDLHSLVVLDPRDCLKRYYLKHSHALYIYGGSTVFL